MSSKKFWAYLRNENGQPIPSASITFKLNDTGNLATIYSTSTSASNDVIDQSTLTTDVSGFFEFFIGDVYEQGTNKVGYSPDQLFRLEWSSSDGRKAGYIDDMQLFYQVFPVDESDSVSRVKNKLASNELTYGWETHRQQSWFFEVHDMTEVDETDSTDTTYSHYVSNKLMNDLKLDLENLQASGGESLSIESSACIVRGFDIPSGSWIPASGADVGLYCYDINHQYNTTYPLFQLWCATSFCVQIPAKVRFLSVDELRICISPDDRGDKHVILISEANIGSNLTSQNPTFEADLQTLNMTLYGTTTNLVYDATVSGNSLLTLDTVPLSATVGFDISPSASLHTLNVTLLSASTSASTPYEPLTWYDDDFTDGLGGQWTEDYNIGGSLDSESVSGSIVLTSGRGTINDVTVSASGIYQDSDASQTLDIYTKITSTSPALDQTDQLTSLGFYFDDNNYHFIHYSGSANVIRVSYQQDTQGSGDSIIGSTAYTLPVYLRMRQFEGGIASYHSDDGNSWSLATSFSNWPVSGSRIVWLSATDNGNIQFDATVDFVKEYS